MTTRLLTLLVYRIDQSNIVILTAIFVDRRQLTASRWLSRWKLAVVGWKGAAWHSTDSTSRRDGFSLTYGDLICPAVLYDLSESCYGVTNENARG